MSLTCHDPIFELIPRAIDLIDYAKQKKVRMYLVDALPFDEWAADGYPVVVTNSIVTYNCPPGRLFRLSDTSWGGYYRPYPLHSTAPITKDFNCFMNRMDPFRQSWLYQLIRRDLFDRGYISFNIDLTRAPWYQEHTAQDAFQDQFEKHLSIFQVEHDLIKDRVPYRNFTDHGDVTPICYESRISLVLETYFDNNHVITYSEKIFRAMQIPRPWLLFSHRHAVKHLHNMGFDVLSDVIDHDRYDTLDCSVSRQSQILDLLATLIDQQIDDSRLQQAAQHNQTLLQKFSRTWVQDIKSVIDEAAIHA